MSYSQDLTTYYTRTHNKDTHTHTHTHTHTQYTGREDPCTLSPHVRIRGAQVRQHPHVRASQVGLFCLMIGLFCLIHRSLLPYTQVSFALYTGLFCLMIGLFCLIHRSLLPYDRPRLPYTQVSFARETGLFCHMIGLFY